ncbi:MAG: rhomboid family intramembrane serine protease [Candidatus Bathyarchaeota archaeon]|nr:rhomboid family intramembrane serine protease [Candidatus Bathyarchaeota archaeon]
MMINVVSSSQKYKVTFVLIALNVAMYIYTSIAGGDFFVTNYTFTTFQLAQYNALVFQGAYYQLLTSMFIHSSIIHLAGNMMFLLIFGLRGEEMFSLPEYLGVYLLGGLAGNVLSLALGPNLISVGASGAVFAMFGACAAYARRSLGQSIMGAIIFGVFLLMISSGENVNYLAHIGGMAAGLAFGYVLARSRRPQAASYRVSYSYATLF